MDIVQRLQQKIQQEPDVQQEERPQQQQPDPGARPAADGMDPIEVDIINMEQQKGREDPRNPIDQDSNDVITIEDDQDSVTEVVNLNVTMPNAQDPNADVPEFEIEDLDDDDTCPDPPSDMSDDDKDDDSDFE